MKLCVFRSSLPDVFRSSPRKMLCKHEANPQDDNHAEARSQQSCFATLLKLHPFTMRLRESAAHPQNTSLQENTSGGIFLYAKRVLKYLNQKKLSFTVFKRNL